MSSVGSGDNDTQSGVGEDTLAGLRKSLMRIRRGLEGHTIDAIELLDEDASSLEGTDREKYIAQLEADRGRLEEKLNRFEGYLSRFEQLMANVEEGSEEAKALEKEHGSLSDFSNDCLTVIADLRTRLLEMKAVPLSRVERELTDQIPGRVFHLDALELERKAAELQRKEEEMNRRAQMRGNNPNNWPPLPSWSPVQPCFYQDIALEIPTQFQKIVRIGYYLWLFYVGVLFVNVLGALAYFVKGYGGGGTLFGVSLVQLALFTPCSFVLWYRPLYKAFRSDSSFNFMMFFFALFVQIIFGVVQAVGINSFGTCGWFNTMSTFSSNIGVAIVMLFPTLGFSFCAGAFAIGLMQVHRLYRSTGASFAKAQQEFSTGIMTNPNVQNAAAQAATSAARSQMGGGGRY